MLVIFKEVVGHIPKRGKGLFKILRCEKRRCVLIAARHVIRRMEGCEYGMLSKARLWLVKTTHALDSWLWSLW